MASDEVRTALPGEQPNPWDLAHTHFHLSSTKPAKTQCQDTVKVHGVFPSRRG
jgi:hypothetical protein